MAYRYCRGCACKPTVLDDICPECGARTHSRFIGTAGRILSRGQLIGFGITLFGFSLTLTHLFDFRYKYWDVWDPVWIMFFGMFIYMLSPYRR